MPIKMAKGRLKSTRRRVTLSSMPEGEKRGRKKEREREREGVSSFTVPSTRVQLLTQLFGCKLMQSRNQSSGCCATPLQPFSCQMRRQHLRCCQPKSSVSSVPHTQSATYRCIVNLASPRLFCCSLCLLFSPSLSTNATLCRQLRSHVRRFQFRFRLPIPFPITFFDTAA